MTGHLTAAAGIRAELVRVYDRMAFQLSDRPLEGNPDTLDRALADLLDAGVIHISPPSVSPRAGAHPDSATPSEIGADPQLQLADQVSVLSAAVERLGGMVGAGVGIAQAWAEATLAEAAAIDADGCAEPNPDQLVACPVCADDEPGSARCPICSGTRRVPYIVTKAYPPPAETPA